MAATDITAQGTREWIARELYAKSHVRPWESAPITTHQTFLHRATGIMSLLASAPGATLRNGRLTLPWPE